MKPSHYDIEGIDPHYVMSLWSKFDPDMTHMESFYRGNALKYLWRYRHKNGLEDIDKCIDELNKLREEYANGIQHTVSRTSCNYTQ